MGEGNRERIVGMVEIGENQFEFIPGGYTIEPIFILKL